VLCIETNNLTKKYGSSLAVDGISLEIKSGQVFGFLGPNGAGKSTVIKLLTTLMPPTKGKLSVLGIDAAKSPLEIRRKIGVVLQQPSYEMTLSVENALDKYGMMWDVDKKTRKNHHRIAGVLRWDSGEWRYAGTARQPSFRADSSPRCSW